MQGRKQIEESRRSDRTLATVGDASSFLIAGTPHDPNTIKINTIKINPRAMRLLKEAGSASPEQGEDDNTPENYPGSDVGIIGEHKNASRSERREIEGLVGAAS